MISREKCIAEKLLQINAIQLNLQTPFQWASGWKSPVYCDNRKILSFPYVREFVKSEMSNLILEAFPQAEWLAGVATGGIAMGAMVADQIKLPFVYVRSKAKDHGLGNRIEGFLEKGKRTVVIEDLISTGGSSLEACRALRAEGADIIGLVSIFNYGFSVSSEAFEAAAIPIKSLSNYTALVAAALEKGIVSKEQMASLNTWRESPESWGKKSE